MHDTNREPEAKIILTECSEHSPKQGEYGIDNLQKLHYLLKKITWKYPLFGVSLCQHINLAKSCY